MFSRINSLPICTNYNDIRSKKLENPYFPASVVVSYAATGDESIKEKYTSIINPMKVRLQKTSLLNSSKVVTLSSSFAFLWQS